MGFPVRIAIDGTAGSGKSTIGELLANRLEYAFLDTGKLYRAIARQAIIRTTTASNEEAVLLLANSLEIKVALSPETGHLEVILAGENLSRLDLHTSEINKVVPVIAAIPGVRKTVRSIQRHVRDPYGAGNHYLRDNLRVHF